MIKQLGYFGAVVYLLGWVASSHGQANREALAQTLQPILDNPPYTGLLIFEVAPKLQADRAAIRIGDILTHYDGKPVQTASQLQRIAREAAQVGKGNLLVVTRRGSQENESTVDAAPLGVRLVAVQKGQRRLLWRTATPNQPNFVALERQAKNSPERWESLLFGEKPAGFAHNILKKVGDNAFVYRVQSFAKAGEVDEKRDVAIAFSTAAPTLPVQALRMIINNKLVLDLTARNGTLAGMRMGIRDSATLSPDTVVAELTGFVAAAMPTKPAACLRCSFLESNALVAAPFADVFCLGAENTKVGKETYLAHRYDVAVFGRSVAHYWVDLHGAVVKTRYGNGFSTIRATPTQIALDFPNAAREFTPIDQLPAFEGVVGN